MMQRVRACPGVALCACRFEQTGQPTMRTNRMMVQGKMAANGPARVEERVYAGHAVPELCQVGGGACARPQMRVHVRVCVCVCARVCTSTCVRACLLVSVRRVVMCACMCACGWSTAFLRARICARWRCTSHQPESRVLSEWHACAYKQRIGCASLSADCCCTRWRMTHEQHTEASQQSLPQRLQTSACSPS